MKRDKGRAAVEILNAAGYDTLTLGNHEFDYGRDTLAALAGLADFPLLTQPTVSEGAPGNEEAARLSGVPVLATKMLTYGLCGFFCAIAGICQAAQEYQGDPEAGKNYVGFGEGRYFGSRPSSNQSQRTPKAPTASSSNRQETCLWLVIHSYTVTDVIFSSAAISLCALSGNKDKNLRFIFALANLGWVFLRNFGSFPLLWGLLPSSSQSQLIAWLSDRYFSLVHGTPFLLAHALIAGCFTLKSLARSLLVMSM